MSTVSPILDIEMPVENIDFKVSADIPISPVRVQAQLPDVSLRSPDVVKYETPVMTSTPVCSKMNSTTESMLSMEVEFLNREKAALNTKIYTLEGKVTNLKTLLNLVINQVVTGLSVWKKLGVLYFARLISLRRVRRAEKKH